jgi:hypothetical protein
MKKAIPLILLTLLSSTILYSQTIKGFWLAGGAFSYTKTKLEPSKTEYSTFTATPRVGHFLIDKLASGLSLHSSVFTAKTRTGEKTKRNEFAAGPFARYYFMNNERKFNLFVDGSVQFGSTKLSGSNTSTENEKLFIYRFATGPVFYFIPHVGLELNVGYQSTRYSSSSKETTWNNSIFIAIGFQVHLTKN